jgi:hypothetical protein
LAPTAAEHGIKLVTHIKPKHEEGGAQVREMLEAVKAAEGMPPADQGGPLLGCLPKEKHSGKLVEVFNNVVSELGLRTVDVGNGYADMLAVKEQPEIMNHKKVSCCCRSL